jgi:hypothetical protein
MKSGVTGQTGDVHRSDRWPPMVEPESPYRFFRPTLGRTDDLDKIQQRGLIGRTDVPSVVPALLFHFEILPIKISPNIVYDNLDPLRSQKKDYVTSRSPLVRPVTRTG